MKLKTFFFLGLFFLLHPPCRGDFGKGTFALSLNNPGVGIRYFRTPSLSIEGRYQNNRDGIQLFSLRGYKYLQKNLNNIKTYGCFELGHILFEGEESEGTGFLGGMSVGFEYFVFKKLGVGLDAGLYYVRLKEKDYSISIGGLGWAVNSALTYYFNTK